MAVHDLLEFDSSDAEERAKGTNDAQKCEKKAKHLFLFES